jgi:hypothetical protein
VNHKIFEKDEIIGILGNKYSQFKTGRYNYIRNYCDNILIIDAKVSIDEQYVWVGDLDLSVKWKNLLDYSRKTGSLIHIMYPIDGIDNVFATFFAGEILFVLNNICENGQIKCIKNDHEINSAKRFFKKKGIRDSFVLTQLAKIVTMCGIR